MKRAICDGKTVIRFVTEYLDEMLQNNSEGALKCYKKTVRERRSARHVELPNGRVFQQILGGGGDWGADGNKRETRRETKGKQEGK